MENKVKESFHENRTVLGKVLPIDTPFTILIDTSDVCNFKCNYCFRATGSDTAAPDYRKNQLMSLETFSRVVEQMKAFPQQIKRISLSHNGESLCNPKLPEMVSMVKEAGFTGCCEIHTNASLLTHEKSDALIKAGLNRMVISLQGLTAEKYKETCGVKISMERFYDELSYLYANKTDDLQMNIKIVDVALEPGEDQLFLEKYSKVADRVFIEQVVPLWGIEAEEKENTSWKNKYGRAESWQECCPLAFYTINVLPSGKIYPCSHLTPPFDLGTVYTTTLYEAWNSPKRIAFLKDMLERGRDAYCECSRCYIPQNTIMMEEDKIDSYRNEILQRMRDK